MGIVQFATAIDRRDVDDITGRLWLAGAVGIVERDRPDGRVELLIGCDAELQPTLAAIVGELPVTSDGWVPLIDRCEIRDSTGPIALDVPANVFGKGDHATTASCLEWVRRAVAPGERVLDLGCGAGLLSIAAARRGAIVTALDIWLPAVDATRANAAANNVAVDARVGSIDVTDDVFDVVLANIGLGVLVDLAPAIERRSRGTIVLSGVLEEQADAAVAAYASSTELERVVADGWATVVLSRL